MSSLDNEIRQFIQSEISPQAITFFLEERRSMVRLFKIATSVGIASLACMTFIAIVALNNSWHFQIPPQLTGGTYMRISGGNGNMELTIVENDPCMPFLVSHSVGVGMDEGLYKADDVVPLTIPVGC